MNIKLKNLTLECLNFPFRLQVFLWNPRLKPNHTWIVKYLLFNRSLFYVTNAYEFFIRCTYKIAISQCNHRINHFIRAQWFYKRSLGKIPYFDAASFLFSRKERERASISTPVCGRSQIRDPRTRHSLLLFHLPNRHSKELRYGSICFHSPYLIPVCCVP